MDALTCAYNGCSMGLCAEKTADELSISRELNDSYAITSYERALDAI